MKPRSMVNILFVVFFIVYLSFSISAAQANEKITTQEAYEIGMEAYIYLYPLVTMDVTRRIHTNYDVGQQEGMGPMNTLANWRTFPRATDRDVVRPNFDTLYSRGWIDLTKGPVVLSAPDTGGRYYLLPMLDMWTDVFAVPGKRTSGTRPSNWALVPPGWNGSLPEGVERIDAPTPYVWLIGRTQTNGPKDYENVHKIQDGYKVTPLSQLGKKLKAGKASIDSRVAMKTEPVQDVNGKKAAELFAYCNGRMKMQTEG